MLVARHGQLRVAAPDLFGTGGAEPVEGAVLHVAGGADRLEMYGAREARDGAAAAVADTAVELDARVRRRDILHGPARHGDALEVQAHPVLGTLPPARHTLRPWRLPEGDRSQDEIVGEHAAADDAGIAVVVVGCRDGNAGAARTDDLLVEQAEATGILVTLEVPAEMV